MARATRSRRLLELRRSAPERKCGVVHTPGVQRVAMGPVARDPGTERVRVDAAMPVFVIDGVDLLKTSNYFFAT